MFRVARRLLPPCVVLSIGKWSTGRDEAVDTPSTRRPREKLLGTYGLRRQKPGGRDKNAPTLGLRALDALPRVAVLVVLTITTGSPLALAQLVQVDLFEHGLFDLVRVVGVHVESGR